MEPQNKKPEIFFWLYPISWDRLSCMDWIHLLVVSLLVFWHCQQFRLEQFLRRNDLQISVMNEWIIMIFNIIWVSTEHPWFILPLKWCDIYAPNKCIVQLQHYLDVTYTAAAQQDNEERLEPSRITDDPCKSDEQDDAKDVLNAGKEDA